MDFEQGLTDAWRAVATFVPKLAAFLLILLIGWFVAKAVAKLVDKVLEKVGFDRLVERGGIHRMLANSRYDASDLLAKLVYYALLLITLQIAFGVWGPNPVSELLTGIVSWLPKAAVAIIIVVVAGAVANAVKDFIGGALGGLSYGRVLANIASIFIWALGIIAALNQIGVATTVTTPVLIAVLATVGGILVVGVGGGLVRPMQQRWEGWLGRAEQELPQAQAQAQAYQRGREDAVRTQSETTPVAPDPVTEPVPVSERSVPAQDPVLGSRRPEDV
ncbi:membrane protein [Lentzea sp. NPDC054927]